MKAAIDDVIQEAAAFPSSCLRCKSSIRSCMSQVPATFNTEFSTFSLALVA